MNLEIISAPNRYFRRKPLNPFYKMLFPSAEAHTNCKNCIKIIDVLSYSDLRAMKNTGGK
jgi:hypothetical protein